MDAKEEALSLVNKIWVKLQNLADGNPVDLGAFFIILTFMREFTLHRYKVPGGVPGGVPVRGERGSRSQQRVFVFSSDDPADGCSDLRELLLQSPPQDQNEGHRHLKRVTGKLCIYIHLYMFECDF